MRLPHPGPGELRWWVVGTVGIGAGVAVAVWLGLSMSVGQTSWQTFGYKVVDDRTVTVTFDVDRPGGAPVTCTVRALARDFGTVGTVDVQVPRAPQDSSRQSATVRTTSRAVTGEVVRCVPR
ncbi:MAG TPA: DUF4307 domain-containing protein [Intrasporangium sp.]|uniref:DUF4307 domain-containing protein n=1 Tax=Intrasporangium sp. TaxID=1925024 RepID=UPI002D787A47|nr:DUF4307 domain-containing protein [Intrasporangium sp.]HET7400034.1 DUF4307 domain-containing protein [Intrasporangium sp.]